MTKIEPYILKGKSAKYKNLGTNENNTQNSKAKI